jgi:TonB family protein
VAFQVFVTVTGARTLEGSEKRELFSEGTMTLLVFGNGAVLPLSSPVSPGQLLFLTNDKTRKEVVCQVVKSKNYRTISGCVELEFTEPMFGFWGMRFPGDPIAPQPFTPVPLAVNSPAATVTPAAANVVAPRVASPVTIPVPRVFEAKPTATPEVVKPPELKPAKARVSTPVAMAMGTPSVPKTEVPSAQRPIPPMALVVPVVARQTAPETPIVHLLRAAEVQSATTSRKPPAAPAGVDLASLPSFSESKPVAPAPAMAQPLAASAPATGTLQPEMARPQEQLSHFLSIDVPPTKGVPPAGISAVDKKPTPDMPANILEIAKEVLTLSPTKASQPAKSAKLPSKPLQEMDAARTPAWLEPLARTAVPPTSRPELLEKENQERLTERPEPEGPQGRALTLQRNSQPRRPLRVLSAGTLFEADNYADQISSGRSHGGILMGAIAAGALLLAGGGAWYFRHQSKDVQAAVTANVAHPPSISENTLPSQPPNNTLPQMIPPQETASDALATSSSMPANKPRAAIVPAKEENVLVAAPRPSPPVNAQPKKPSLGGLHLAAPAPNRRSRALDNNDADPGVVLSGTPPEPNENPLGVGLAANSKQPAAPNLPSPVGGNLKPAKLISSVAPVYPSRAKTQHVSGDVRVDALIDTTGRVTTMKVVSGPTPLQQAAMDALRQWKYQPAMLDGKAVPAHLTVTLQFRLAPISHSLAEEE